MSKEQGVLKRIENGCLSCLIVVMMIGLTVAVGVLAVQLFSYQFPFTFLQIWTATSIVLLPIVFLALFYLDWRMMPEKPYAIVAFAESEFDEPLRAKIGQRFILIWLGLILCLVMVGIILITVVIHWEPQLVNIWALMLTVGLTLAALSGFVAGGIYMEDYRKGVLLVGCIFFPVLGFLFIGLPMLTDDLHFTPRYFGGILVGFLISLATWHYLSRRWDPALMATVYESRMDAFFTYSSVGQLIFVLTLIGLRVAIPLLGFEDVALPCLGVWILLTFGYMMTRVFWNRPRSFDI